MRILITGASGLLGERFYNLLSEEHEVTGTYSSKFQKGLVSLDLTNRESIDLVVNKAKPGIVIHSAAISNPDICEKNRGLAFQVNTLGTQFIVDACKRHSSFLVFLSTNHVFQDGEITSRTKPFPLNYYGQTKLQAEDYIAENLNDSIILRPSKLYGLSARGDFTTEMLDKLRSGEEIKADNVSKYYPILTDDVVNLTTSLLEREERGIYYVGTSQPYTKFQWVKLIASTFGLSQDKITPIQQMNPAARPLDIHFSQELADKLNFQLTPLKQGIMKIKDNLKCG